MKVAKSYSKGIANVHLFMAVFMHILMLFLHSVFWFFCLVLHVTFFTRRLWEHGKVYTWIEVFFLILFFLKVGALFSVSWVFGSPYDLQTSESRMLKPIYQFFLLTDTKRMEAMTTNFVVWAYHMGPDSIDTFSGKRMVNKDGIIYSVGPDRVDDKLQLLYDPTNGTYSAGDILPDRSRDAYMRKYHPESLEENVLTTEGVTLDPSMAEEVTKEPDAE
jgi:hypothetical protein